MCENKKDTLLKVKNQNGFTLIELIVVVAIIGILTSIGTTYFTYLKFRSNDSQAFIEGRHLLTAVNDAILNLEDIDFETPAGGSTGPIGNKIHGGGSGSREPVFTLSSSIWCRVDLENTPNQGDGFMEAYVWSVGGTEDGITPSGRKEYYYYIDENLNILSSPSF